MLSLPSVILSAAAHHFDDRPGPAGGSAAPVTVAAEPVVVPPRPISRKRRRQTAELPPVLASNILVDNLEDHEVFFDRASARRRPTERQRG